MCLARHEAPIRTAPGHKLAMGAAFYDVSVLQHQNAVGVDHAGQAMSKNDRGPAAHQPVECLLYHRLVLGIDRGQGLVEHQNRGVTQQGPGDGDALALTAGKPDSPFADDSVIAPRQPGDEVMGVGGPGGGFELLAGRLGLAEAQIVLDRTVEQIRVLIDDSELRADLIEAERFEIAAAEPYGANLGIVEPEQQPHDRRLAGSR